MKPQNRELFIIALVTLLTVIGWIIVDVYHIQKNKAFVVDYQKSTQINIEVLDSMDVLNTLQERKQ